MDLQANPKAAAAAWPDTMYKGQNLLDVYCNTSAFEDALNAMHDSIDSQECYLGYLPDTDQFISGHDVWYDETEECDECEGIGTIEVDDDVAEECNACCGDGCIESNASEEYMGNAFLCELDENGEFTVIDTVAAIGRMFYSDGMYRHVQDTYPNIVDVRLD